MDGSTQQDAHHTYAQVWCGLGSDVPRYAEKVPCRYRSARSLAFSTLPCESWAGRAGLHGLDGRSRVSGSAAFVHSCPPNVTLLPCNGIKPLLLLACAGACMDASGEGQRCSHIPACSACTGELRLLGPSSSSTRTSQQHRISANLLARRDASPNLLLRWCCVCVCLLCSSHT